MMVMPSNNTNGIVHYYAGKYPGKIGLLISPDGWRRSPDYLPYALDNGCFTEWNPGKFFGMLKQAIQMNHQPMWVCVPDAVGDRHTTLERWYLHHERIKDMGFSLAFVVQDGMTPGDVPSQAKCCFVGGTTEWKLEKAGEFKGVCERLHIGRVNTLKRIQWAESIGADSVDGTGFFRGRDKKHYDFRRYFEGDSQCSLF